MSDNTRLKLARLKTPKATAIAGIVFSVLIIAMLREWEQTVALL